MTEDLETNAVPAAIARYKRILESVLNNRPSGTRLMLANTLDKNRSFISQIANPAYATPIPAQHLSIIFDVCHFSSNERKAFLEAYSEAHPRRIIPNLGRPQMRTIAVSVPDFGDPAQNRLIDDMVADFARKMSQFAKVLPSPPKEENNS